MPQLQSVDFSIIEEEVFNLCQVKVRHQSAPVAISRPPEVRLIKNCKNWLARKDESKKVSTITCKMYQYSVLQICWQCKKAIKHRTSVCHDRFCYRPKYAKKSSQWAESLGLNAKPLAGPRCKIAEYTRNCKDNLGGVAILYIARSCPTTSYLAEYVKVMKTPAYKEETQTQW